MKILIIILIIAGFSLALYFLVSSVFTENYNNVPFSNDDFTKLTKYVVPEAKDLCKTFLTLATAVLVASITFSEKIVQFQTADQYQKTLIISAWLLILVSIILCGMGLSVLMFSEACVIFHSCDHTAPLLKAATLLFTACISFAFGLLFFILTAVLSTKFLLNKPA